MDIWATNKLVLFITFVVPGFISLKTFELLSPRNAKETKQQLIDAVAYSSVNYALLSWPISIIESGDIRSSHPNLYSAFYLFVLFVAPVSWACLLKWFRTTKFALKNLSHPAATPWDFVFEKRQRYWIIATLKDGQKIGGRYDSHSFSSSAPSPERIYLEECWELNDRGGFERPRQASAGVLILTSELISLEFFNIQTGEDNDEPTKARTPGDATA